MQAWQMMSTEIHLKQWELQREQLQSCRGWCSKGGITPCSKGKVHNLTVGHSSRFLACPCSGCSWTHTDDWIFPMFLLSLTKSLCTTQLEKKKSSAPTPLPVQQVGVLPFAMGRICCCWRWNRATQISSRRNEMCWCELQPVSLLLTKKLWAFILIHVWNISRGPLPAGVPGRVTQVQANTAACAQICGSSENRKLSRQLFREV